MPSPLWPAAPIAGPPTSPRQFARAGWLPLLLGSLICLSAALYNGFPLVTSDSGTYLNSALHLNVPTDRPIVYGLFVRATSWRFSCWLVVLAQSLLLAGLLLRYVAEFAPRLRGASARLALLGGLAWLTGFSWYCSQLMPDIFTALGLLALGLLVLGRFRTRAGQLGLLGLLLLSTIMHNANLLSFSLTALGFGAVAWQQRLFGRGLVRRAHWLAATATVLAGWLVLPAVHAACGGGFVLTRAAPVFLLARFVEGGLVDQYLADHCGDWNAPGLCAYRDQLPNDAITFLWEPSSPYYRSGGLEANLPEYRRIVRGILTTPRYYPYLTSLAAQSTLRQLTRVAPGDGLWAYRDNTNPYWKVQEYAPYELKAYLSSLQNRNALDFKDLTARTYTAQLLALLVVAAAFGAARRGEHRADHLAPYWLLLTMWGMGLVANAFAAGALANVADRLQGRAAWLLPFWALLLVADTLLPLLNWLRAWWAGGPVAPRA